VKVSHADGYVTRYAHNSKNLVSVGDVVRKGTPIALMGATGRTTGTHLHYEVHHNGRALNPKTFVSRPR
jgi:murein DD-endopeptidase MepM/ murein hydrolase activator NlpD